MLAEQTSASGLPLDALTPVCGAADLIEAAAAARAVHVEESLHRYVVSLLHHTRADQRLALGGEPARRRRAGARGEVARARCAAAPSRPPTTCAPSRRPCSCTACCPSPAPAST